MKKLLVILICLLLIIVGMYSIDYLLTPRDFRNVGTTTIVSFKDYSLFNYGDHFKTYVIDIKDEFDYSIERIKLKYENGTLSINEKVIENVESVYDYFAIYEDNFVVLGYSKDGNSYIMNYNLNLDKEMIISDYKGMLVDLNEGLIFEDEGIIVNYSFVKDNRYIKDDSSICDVKNKEMTMIRAVEHYYDRNEKFIDKTEELYSMNLMGYINKYQICK